MRRLASLVRPASSVLLLTLLLGSWAPGHEAAGLHGPDHGAVFVVDHAHPVPTAHLETATPHETALCLACLLRSRSEGVLPGPGASPGNPSQEPAVRALAAADPVRSAVGSPGSRAPPRG